MLSNTTWRILQDYLNLDRARLIKAYGAEDAGPLFLSESGLLIPVSIYEAHKDRLQPLLMRDNRHSLL